MKCQDSTRKCLCKVETVDEVYLKFEILAISECYFTLKSEGDEKGLLREAENCQTSRN